MNLSTHKNNISYIIHKLILIEYHFFKAVTNLPTLGYPVRSKVRVLGSRAGNLEICLRTSSRYPIREKERENKTGLKLVEFYCNDDGDVCIDDMMR